MLSKIADKINRCIYWPILLVTGVISYGYLIVTYTYGVNDEVIKYYVYEPNMVRQDRIGVYLVNKLFQCYDLIPFWGDAVGLVFLTAAAIAWVFVMDECANHKLSKAVLTVAACLLIAFPYIGKAAVFKGNLALGGQVLFAAALAVLFYCYFIKNNRMKDIILAFLFGVIVLCFDKAYITSLIMGMAFMYWMYIRQEQVNWKKILMDALKIAVWLLAIICIAVLLVRGLQFILKVSPSHYTTKQYMRYNDSGLLKQMAALVPALFHKFLEAAKTEWSAKALCVAFAGTLLIGIAESVKRKSAWNLLISVVVVLDVSLIYLITGNLSMPERSVCHVFALFVALFFTNFCYCIGQYLEKIKWVYIVALCIGTLFVANFSREMEFIYYNRHMAFEKDKMILDGVMHDIYAQCGYNTPKPIIFMGLPNDMIRVWPEVENASVFSWNRLAVYEREEYSKLLYSFINNNGYNVKAPSEVDFAQVRGQISSMSNWPEEGCIQEFDEYILVKLGDSKCEIIDQPREELMKECAGGASDVQYAVEHMDANGRNINLRGWAVINGKNSYTNNISTVLLSQDTDRHYKIRTDEKERKDITSNIGDGINYDNSGYSLSIGLSDYVLPGRYDVFLMIESMYGKYMVGLDEEIVIE